MKIPKLLWLLCFFFAPSLLTQAQDWKFYNKQAEKNYKTGKLPEAIVWAEKALYALNTSPDKQNLSYSFVYDNLAKLYVEASAYEKAENIYLIVQELRLKELGENHLDYATALDNLAMVYQLEGNYDKATPMLLLSKEIREKNASTLHPDYAHTLDNLAFL
jgi:tetratricopeptide (TPR) repeat protein